MPSIVVAFCPSVVMLMAAVYWRRYYYYYYSIVESSAIWVIYLLKKLRTGNSMIKMFIINCGGIHPRMDLNANKQQTRSSTGPRTKAMVAFHNRKSLFVGSSRIMWRWWECRLMGQSGGSLAETRSFLLRWFTPCFLLYQHYQTNTLV